MLSPTRRALALVCAVALVIVAVPSLFVPPAEFILFQPAPYQQQLAKQNIYNLLPYWLAAITVTNGGAAGQNALALMSKATLQSVYFQVLSPAWAKTQVDGLITQLWDFLNFKTPQLTLTVDLRELKSRLSAAGPDSVGGQILRSWPACNLDQLLKLGAVLAGGLINGSVPSDMPLCRPSDNLMPLADQMMQSAFSTFAATIPDQVNLVDYFKALPNFDQQQATLVKIYSGYTAARWLGRILPWIALFLFFVLIAFTAVSWRTAFTYTGISLLVTGILGGITALVLWLVASRVVDTLVQGMTAVSDEMLKAGTLAVQQVFSLFLIWAVVLAIIVTGIGLVAAGLPRIIRQQN